MAKGVDITWINFSAVKHLNNTEKKNRVASNESIEPVTIISKISGIIKSGSFTAILGSSGSGKTTFLNFLSNRIHYLGGLKCTGDIFINGTPRKNLDFNSVAGYVMQEEVLLNYLKVRETLEFIASFKISRDKVANRVDELISQLNLKNCETALIGGGSMNKGISGGEKKRLAIGVEMIANPSILFLDEPTTGLDSFNAESLIELLNNLARTGVTVIATIHQPNSYIFAQLDRILLLGGQDIIYHGKSRKCVQYIKNLGFEVPKFSNPAEILLRLVTESEPNYAENIKILKAEMKSKKILIECKPLPSMFQKKKVGFIKELFLLIRRSMLNITRNRISILYKILANLLFLLLILASFFDACKGTSIESLKDRCAGILILQVYMAFLGVNSTTSLSTDKEIFIREQASKTYSPAAFYLSKLLFDIPFDQTLVCITAFLLYFAVGLSLDDPTQIFFFVFIIMLLDLNTRGWGNLLFISLPSIEVASASIPFVILIQLLFGGVFINFSRIPSYLIWLEYSSMFKYSWGAAMRNELDDWDISACADKNPGNPICDPIGYYTIILSKEMNILALSMIIIGIHVLAYIFLARLAHKFRIN